MNPEMQYLDLTMRFICWLVIVFAVGCFLEWLWEKWERIENEKSYKTL